MSKVRIELSHRELALVRALLGKTNVTIPGASELFNRVADKADALNLDKFDLQLHSINGLSHLYYSLGTGIGVQTPERKTLDELEAESSEGFRNPM